MRTPAFEKIGKPQWDPSGVFRIRYGSGLDDPLPFVLTVTLPYVARELGRSVSFAEISKYVEQNAETLKATARFPKSDEASPLTRLSDQPRNVQIGRSQRRSRRENAWARPGQ